MCDESTVNGKRSGATSQVGKVDPVPASTLNATQYSNQQLNLSHLSGQVWKAYPIIFHISFIIWPLIASHGDLFKTTTRFS